VQGLQHFFSANGAVEQEVIVVAMVIALFYLHASDVHQHTFNRSRVRLCVRTPTPEVGLTNLRACKTWSLSNSWATGWRMQPIMKTLESLNAF